MDYLTFDIETIGKPWDKFDKKSKEIFKEWAQRDSNTEEEFERALEQVKDGLPFSPFMGEVVAIAAYGGDILEHIVAVECPVADKPLCECRTLRERSRGRKLRRATLVERGHLRGRECAIVDADFVNLAVIS